MVSRILFSQSWSLWGLLMLLHCSAGSAVYAAEKKVLPSATGETATTVSEPPSNVTTASAIAAAPAASVSPTTATQEVSQTASQIVSTRVDAASTDPGLASPSKPIVTTRAANLMVGSDIGSAIATDIEGPQPKQNLKSSAAINKPEEAKKTPKSASPLLTRFLTPRAATDQPTANRPPLNPFSNADKPASDSNQGTTLPGDPELGVLQVAEVRGDNELGVIQLRSPLQDPELGILELQQISLPAQRLPFLFLSTYVSASSSDNVFLVEDPVQGRFGDNFIRPGLSITAFPALGPNTNLLVSARTSFLRYEEQSNSSYDELRFQTGIRHRFTERVYGQLSMTNQLLFDEGYRDQFFTNTGLEVTIGRRDTLTPQLTLDSFYQGQLFFSEPEEFSNVLNSVGAYLNYRITPRWDTGISYRLTISDFTRQSRHETYQRVIGQLRYTITPSVRVSLFGGLSYGRSSESRITFDDTFFGISFDATISIF